MDSVVLLQGTIRENKTLRIISSFLFSYVKKLLRYMLILQPRTATELARELKTTKYRSMHSISLQLLAVLGITAPMSAQHLL